MSEWVGEVAERYEEIEQPPMWEFHEADDIFIKQIPLLKAGWTVIQHVHEYDHLTLVASGRVRAWVGKDDYQDYMAPAVVFVKKGETHRFTALADGTVLYCVHRLHGMGVVSSREEAWPEVKRLLGKE